MPQRYCACCRPLQCPDKLGLKPLDALSLRLARLDSAVQRPQPRAAARQGIPDLPHHLTLQRLRTPRAVAAHPLVGPRLALVVPVAPDTAGAVLPAPTLTPANANHPVATGVAEGHAGQEKRLLLGARRPPCAQAGHLLLGRVKVLRVDYPRVASGHPHSKPGVGAQTGAVSQHVPHSHNAPATAAAGGSLPLVEVAHNAPHAHIIPDVQPENQVNGLSLLRHHLQRALGTNPVAIGRLPQPLSPKGLGHHRLLDALPPGPAPALPAPPSEGLLERVRHILIVADDPAAQGLQLKHSADGGLQGGPEVMRACGDDKELCAGLLHKVEHVPELWTHAIPGFRLDECLHGLVPLAVAVAGE